MKKLVALVNDLECSGKTSLPNILHNSYIDAGYNTLLVTTSERDINEGSGGEFWDFEDEIDLSTMIGAIDNNDIVILDISSGSARTWAEFCENNELATVLSEIDAEMTLVLPVHPSERNLNEVVDLLEIFSDSADYVIAHLPIEARRSEGQKWKGSQAAKAAKFLGASEINLPDISADLATALDAHGLSLPQALHQLKNLPRFVEVELMQWREAAGEIVSQEEAYLFAEPVSAGLNY